ADNIAEDNQFIDNITGITMMYDTGDIIRNNYIAKATGSVGVCLSLKESSDVVVENNDLMYCSSGIAIDVSPYEPGSKNRIHGNRIAFNDIGVSFVNDWKDSVFTGNLFTGNITEVAIYGGGSAKRNVWDGNRWEDYQGFDRNGDGVGDKPHRLFGYAGQVWMDVPNTRFFKGTPLLEVLDFLDRLAPFSEPTLLLEDQHPRLGSDKTFKAGSNLEPKL
ncbi:MAG: nitrous oxide reductase family maturation protein NosD, partial [Magnetospirillum sp.]